MSETRPVIWWLRRDLRLSDNPCLQAALATGQPVIPVVILDPLTEAQGAAPLWRWGLGLGHFTQSLDQIGGRLIFRRGEALAELQKLIAETGATTVMWSRLYAPDVNARDAEVKTALKEADITAQSHPGHLLFEPWTVKPKSSPFYKVYTPMWKAVRDIPVAEPSAAPGHWPAPDTWPDSDSLEDWQLGRAMRRGADIVLPHCRIGEAAAQERLDQFIAERIDAYKDERDYPSIAATSRLSENLTYGEIGIRSCWHAAMRAKEEGARGAEHFLKELAWREFAYHILHHTPHIAKSNWREGWDNFGWSTEETPEVTAWKQGRTGVPMVDAAMREMYVTGIMHNRARMIVASYLTKHLMTHWKIGLAWFEDCLIDWDPASNALGWQWTAGSGPDAAPYFRIYNPLTQREKFDANKTYVDAWIAEEKSDPTETALTYFQAVPQSWGLSPSDPYPDEPVVGISEGRKRALEAYEARDF